MIIMLFLQQKNKKNERKMGMNMSVKKWVVTFLMVLAMIVSLIGCGGSKSPAGTYNLTTWNSGGMEMSVEEMSDLFGMDVKMTLDLKDDNSFTVDMGFWGEGESVSGTWQTEGDSLILSAEGDDFSVNYDGKTIVMDMEGEILTFEKQ